MIKRGGMKIKIKNLTSYSGDFSDGSSIIIGSSQEVTSTLKDATTRLMGSSPQGFSDSVIVLEINHHSVENFEVIDTPGIVESGYPVEDIEFLKAIVRDYMKEENTIILVAVECSGDLMNQKMLDFVKNADESQKRTKILLTKADLIEIGDEERWVELVRGDSEGEFAMYAKKLGCTVIRARTPQELLNSISEEERLAEEKKLFESKIWENVYKGRIGTWSLSVELDKLLADLMKRCVPKLLSRVESKLEQTKNELKPLADALPEDPKAQMQVIHERVDRLSNSIKQLFALQQDPDGEKNMFILIRQINQLFRISIQKTTPSRYGFPDIEISGENEDLKSIHGIYVSQDTKNDRPSYRRDDGDEGLFLCFDGDWNAWWIGKSEEDICATAKDTADTPDKIEAEWTTRRSLFSVKTDIRAAISDKRESGEAYLNRVKQIAAEEQARLLPDAISTSVRPKLIKEITSKWHNPTDEYICAAYELIHKGVMNVLHEIMARFPNLCSSVRGQLQRALDAEKDSAKTLIATHLQMESYEYTLNEHYLRDIKYKNFKKVLSKRLTDSQLLDELKKLKFMGTLEEIEARHPGLIERIRETLPLLNSADNTIDLLELMASVHAYVKVASKRFIDYVVMAVDLHMMRFSEIIRKDVVIDLCSELTDEKLANLLWEDEEMVRRRGVLLKNRERLELAEKHLRELG